MDRNLDDQWLERLNNLETFNLINICEGHIDVNPTSVKRNPRIILRPKEAYIRPLTAHWYDLKKALAAEIERIWPDDETIIEFEIQHRLVKKDDYPADIEDIIIRITSERRRDIVILPEWLVLWFRLSLIRIRVFDRFMKNLIIIEEEQG